MIEEIQNLENRLKDLIINTCNKIGCDKCGLSWKEDNKEKCSATELEGRIHKLKYSAEFTQETLEKINKMNGGEK